MEFCDLKCVYASAPKEDMDGSRSCMTFTAIYCSRFEKHVMKSQPCRDKKVRPSTRLGAGRADAARQEAAVKRGSRTQ